MNVVDQADTEGEHCGRPGEIREDEPLKVARRYLEHCRGHPGYRGGAVQAAALVGDARLGRTPQVAQRAATRDVDNL